MMQDEVPGQRQQGDDENDDGDARAAALGEGIVISGPYGLDRIGHVTSRFRRSRRRIFAANLALPVAGSYLGRIMRATDFGAGPLLV